MPAQPAVTDKRIRTLTYRRAVWSRRAPYDLQEFVRLISELPHTEIRTFPYKGEFLTSLAWRRESGKTFGHIAQWAKNRPTSTVEDPSPILLETDTKEFPPPTGRQYVGGDIMFLATGNHLLSCPSGAREAVVDYYLAQAAELVEGGAAFSYCSLEPIANLDKVQLIQREGVRSIRLDASLYEATMIYEEQQRQKEGPKIAIFRNIGQALKELLAVDMGLPEIAKDENLTVRLEISYDGRKRGGELGQQRIEGLARDVIEEGDGDGGFVIVTREGKTIKPSELSLRSSLPLIATGNTVVREAAWDALTEFYDRLRQSGALET